MVRDRLRVLLSLFSGIFYFVSNNQKVEGKPAFKSSVTNHLFLLMLAHWYFSRPNLSKMHWQVRTKYSLPSELFLYPLD